MKSFFRQFLIIGLPTTTTIGGVSIIPQNWGSVIKWVIVGLASIIIAVILTLIETKKKISFNEDSRRFQMFFKQWYTKPGVIHIFCTDVHWMTSEILSAIKSKGNGAHVFLRDETGGNVEELKRAGVHIHVVNPNIGSQYRFSIRESDGIKRIIIRNKQEDNDKISFLQTSEEKDPYLISMALDLLEYCKVTPN